MRTVLDQNPTGHVLYCGDGDMLGAASYLGGLMASWGWAFEYVDGDAELSPDKVNDDVSLVVFSDYPARRLTSGCHGAIESIVRKGAGIIMIGGWSSFQGSDGQWAGTQVAGLLPVEMSTHDDRVNFDGATALKAPLRHPVTKGLPWATRPPAIGGLNRLRARPEAKILLECQQFDIRLERGELAFTPSRSDLLLAVGSRGAGRTAAFATDIAPHWVGPLVDWGDQRLTIQGPGPKREVGGLYAQLIFQLLNWTRRAARPGEMHPV